MTTVEERLNELERKIEDIRRGNVVTGTVVANDPTTKLVEMTIVDADGTTRTQEFPAATNFLPEPGSAAIIQMNGTAPVVIPLQGAQVAPDGSSWQSPDFVTGVSGWKIYGDGSAEFNDVIVRGTLQAALIESNPTVLNPNVGNETAPVAGDQLANGTFDVNITGWVGSNCTLARVTSPTPQAGAGAMSLTASSAATMHALSPSGTSGVPVFPMSTYRLTGYFRTAVTARSCRFRVLFYDSTGTLIAGSPGWGAQGLLTITDGSGSWGTQHSFYVTAPPNAAYAAVQATVTSPASSEVHYVDSVTLTETCRNYGYVGNLDPGGPWANDQTAVTRDTGTKWGGAASVAVDSGPFLAIVGGGAFPVVPEAVYRMGGMIRKNTGTVAALSAGIAWYPADMSGTSLSVSDVTHAAPGVDFAPFQFSGQAPASIGGSGPPVYGVPFLRASLNNTDFWIDDLAVTRTSLYEDGIVRPDVVVSRTEVYDGDGTLIGRGLTTPVGVILPYAGQAEPEGWLFCYGQAIDRWLFHRLFAVLGTTFGVGNGTTTYNLPDLRGKVPVGIDNMGGADAGVISAANTFGAVGGHETGAFQDIVDPGAGFVRVSLGTAGNNMQPYMLLNYIIKY